MLVNSWSRKHCHDKDNWESGFFEIIILNNDQNMMKYKCFPLTEYQYSAPSAFINTEYRDDKIAYPVYSFDSANNCSLTPKITIKSPINRDYLFHRKLGTNCSNSIINNRSPHSFNRRNPTNACRNPRHMHDCYQVKYRNTMPVNLSAKWASMNSDKLLPSHYMNRTNESERQIKIKVLSKKVKMGRKNRSDKESNYEPPPIDRNRQSNKQSANGKTPTITKTQQSPSVTEVPQQSPLLTPPFAISTLPLLSSQSPSPSLPSPAYDSSSNVLHMPVPDDKNDNDSKDYQSKILKSVFDKEGKTKISNYQNVLGELKSAISKVASPSNSVDKYILPSNVIKQSSVRIPPVVPRPPETINKITQPLKSKLRHVTPPVSPLFGRVLGDYQRPDSLRSRQSIDSTKTQIKYDISNNIFGYSDEDNRETHYLNPQEQKIINFLPLNIPEDQTTFVADDGTEWNVLIVKSNENVDDAIRKIIDSSDDLEYVTGQNLEEYKNIQAEPQIKKVVV
ncbi:hypothetical protein GJ496_009756 [Pomphorhynchus laevis]|nr:hypothetical protein GJ496_009756 [Pomphorhynchus laevis]